MSSCHPNPGDPGSMEYPVGLQKDWPWVFVLCVAWWQFWVNNSVWSCFIHFCDPNREVWSINWMELNGDVVVNNTDRIELQVTANKLLDCFNRACTLDYLDWRLQWFKDTILLNSKCWMYGTYVYQAFTPNMARSNGVCGYKSTSASTILNILGSGPWSYVLFEYILPSGKLT